MIRWTANDIPDLRGKVILVTGANSGLGLATSEALAQKGALVVMACRGAAKAEQAMQTIRAKVPGAQLEFLELDLSSQASIKAAVAAFKSRHNRLDVLCNNAGVMTLPYSKTKDGFEMLMGTNHFGHFALTGLLLDVLNATPGARIVTVSSQAHRGGKLPMNDLNWEHEPYSKPAAYARSKLANLLFALELNRRLRKSNSGVLSLASHPGFSATNIVFGGSSGTSATSIIHRIWNLMASFGNTFIGQKPEQGALPSLRAATDPAVKGGEYYGPHGLFEFWGYPIVVKPAPRALDEKLAAALWTKSEELTGIRYPG